MRYFIEGRETSQSIAKLRAELWADEAGMDLGPGDSGVSHCDQHRTRQGMSKHTYTPGPWTLETVRTSCGICHKIGPFPPRLNPKRDEPTYACVYVDYPAHDESHPRDQELRANATLIAAAPEMVEALRLLVSDVQDYPAWQRPCHALDVARAALTRAGVKP